ncbi:MAG: DASS family sodium-coupled anion symporter [bacterium]
MTNGNRAKATGYDKYVNYKTFLIAAAAFIILTLIPVSKSMLDVGVEYGVGKKYALNFISQELFHKKYSEVEQWQAMTAQILEANMMQGAFDRERALRRDESWIKKNNIPVQSDHLEKFYKFIGGIDEKDYSHLMREAYDLRHDKLKFSDLSDKDKEKALKATRFIKISVAMVAFVIICFVTEAMPLPGVAFCVGMVLVLSGIANRDNVASLFWSDSVWFIMGSLMFAAAFVKTGVDKRICILLFKYLAKPNIKAITGIMILLLAPLAGLMSDHALAAMFLPIGIALYINSLNGLVKEDNELAKMLMITICMAVNIGGFGTPSGGARNVVMMAYMEDMFGLRIGYAEWILYAFPFLLVMMPFLWVMINWRFKPKITDLGPALDIVKQDVAKMGRWRLKQIVAVVIFLTMLFCWITEDNLLNSLLGFRLGIGVISVAGALCYLIFGIVNWRDYHERVDWGVVWLYAGAIAFGKMLTSTGAAYWLSRSIVDVLTPLGVASGKGLIIAGVLITTFMTNLMADGPAAAAVGPITLNMAAIEGLGTTLVPFMGLATACAASYAYLLIIGTPPNAIVYSSGYLEPKDFLRVGIPCVIFAIILVILMSIFYWALLGFHGLPAM